MRRMEARRRNASAVQLRFSQSLASRRQRLSQASVRSTIQRLPARQISWPDRTIDDLPTQARKDFLERGVELPSLIAGIGEQRLQEGIHSEQRRKQQDAAVAILDVGGMNN